MDAAVYAIILSTFIGIFVIAYDFYRYCQKIGRLSLNQIPDLSNAIEQCYQNYISEITDQMRELKLFEEKGKGGCNRLLHNVGTSDKNANCCNVFITAESIKGRETNRLHGY